MQAGANGASHKPVLNSLIVLLIAAVLTAGAAFWVLRAYRRAGGGAGTAVPALAACFAVGIVGLGIYLVIGRPEMADAPYAARLEALKRRDPTSYTHEEALAILDEAAHEHPNDPLPFLYSGQVLLDQDRAAEAARAYDAALRRDPELAEAMLGLGRAMVRMDGGQVSPEALALFQRAGERLNDPTPWVYQAMAAMQAGQDREAGRFWGEALQRMSPDDPRRQMAGQFASGQRPQQ